MDLKLDFDAAKIAEKMQEAIMTSTFKEMFTKAAQTEIDALAKGTGTWGSGTSGIQQLVRTFIQSECRDILETEWKDKIRELIKLRLTEGDQIDKLVTECLDSMRFKGSY